MSETKPSVELKKVVKRFAGVPAVRELDLVIPQGEFFSLLGPSGCGKSTTLRLIGGLERPDSGEILIDGEVVNDVPPYRRSSNIVFQNYALFPHLTIADNVAFGLRLRSRRTPAAEVEPRVEEVLELVHLEGFGKRYPDELSGGQQQRVALARALVLNPRVLLLDEPLGALDRKLRKDMQIELRRLQAELGITFLYVTHDQEEAMSMSDRVAVMRDGRFEQVAPPEEIFQKPKTRFTADFMGASNILSGKVRAADPDQSDGHSKDRLSIDLDSGITITSEKKGGVGPGDRVEFSVRPDDIYLRPPGDDLDTDNRFEGSITEKVYLGDVTEFDIDLGGGISLVCRSESREAQRLDLRKNQAVLVGWDAEDCNLLDG
jgi:spermidine/putrescine transport system ATP-binding protein